MEVKGTEELQTRKYVSFIIIFPERIPNPQITVHISATTVPVQYFPVSTVAWSWRGIPREMNRKNYSDISRLINYKGRQTARGIARPKQYGGGGIKFNSPICLEGKVISEVLQRNTVNIYCFLLFVVGYCFFLEISASSFMWNYD